MVHVVVLSSLLALAQEAGRRDALAILAEERQGVPHCRCDRNELPVWMAALLQELRDHSQVHPERKQLRFAFLAAASERFRTRCVCESAGVLMCRVVESEQPRGKTCHAVTSC